MTITALDLQSAVDTSGLDILLLAEYGSRAHGAHTSDSDHDLLGIYVERDHELYGLQRPETLSYRIGSDGQLAALQHTPSQTPSAEGIVEVTFHPLRKYVSLAAAGNPTVLSVLWSHELLFTTISPAGAELIANRDLFLSRHAIFRHAGYASAQRDELLGLRRRRTNRPALLERHGFDVKAASHMIRLLQAGLDLARDRELYLPMKSEQIELLMEIRAGAYSLDDVVQLSYKLEHDLADAIDESDLPESADMDGLNVLLRRVRNEHLGRAA